MNDIEFFASVRPEVADLSDDDRAAIRQRLFPGVGRVEGLRPDGTGQTDVELGALPRSRDRQTDRSPRLLIAAAMLLTVGVVGVWAGVARRGDSSTITPATQPPTPVEVVAQQPALVFETPTVSFSAGRVATIADGRSSSPDDDVDVHSDPGIPNRYTTLELSWDDGGFEQRLYLYFASDGVDWWANEIRTYDRTGEWYEPIAAGEFFRMPLGEQFVGDVDLPNLHIEGLTLEAFLRPFECADLDRPTAIVANYPLITSGLGTFGTTFWMVDTATCRRVPLTPFDFEFATDDPAVALPIRTDEPIDHGPMLAGVELDLLQPGEATLRIIAKDASGVVVDTAESQIVVVEESALADARHTAYSTVVADVLAELGWQETAAERLDDPFTGISVATPDAGSGSVTITFTVHLWYPGEYSDDVEFRQAIVGSVDAGVPIEGGTLFVIADAAGTSERSTVVVLTPSGSITIEAAPVPGTPDPRPVPDVITVSGITDVARELTAELPAIVAGATN